MKYLVTAAIVILFATNAYAQTSSCKSEAASKKLAGRALDEFMKLCEANAALACEKKAAERKLGPGPANVDFTRKCVKDAVEGMSCKDQAADRKLSGAASTSFLNKCKADVRRSCDASAAERKLAGAAKASFTKKCVDDAYGD